MSKKVVLLGDLGADHAGFPPTPVIAGSPDVFIDGKPVARVGDPLAPHSKPKHPPHPRAIAGGSSTVLINGMPAAVTGGAITCGGVTIGSGSVIIGDTYTPTEFSGVSPMPTQAPSQTTSAAAAVGSSAADTRLASQDALHNLGRTADASRALAGGDATSTSVNPEPKTEEQKATVEPGFHVVQSPMSKTSLLTALYGDASAKPNNFDRLNPGLESQVLPGEMIVLGDPEAKECTSEEAMLMEVAAQVNARVRSLEQDEAQFLVKHYDLLEAVTSTGSAGLGAGAVMVSKQLDSIKIILKDVELLHQESYRKHGHLNHPDFFEKRRALFKKLDFALGSLARRGMSLDDDAKLKRALGLSSKSVVSHWKKAGIGDIPGYASHYDRLATGSKYVRGAGYLGILLDSSFSALNIHEACTSGNEKECQVVSYQEGGRLAGSIGGGVVGAGLAGACVAVGVTSVGVGAIACAVIVGGVGSATVGHYGGKAGEYVGEKVREAIYE